MLIRDIYTKQGDYGPTMHLIVEIKSNRLIILTMENDNYPIMFKK